jgi:glycosyltransferase involved in cell wall biosynthesis
MRVLILSQWFDPEPAFKGLNFARELVKQGHQVEVLTGFPNYPGGKLYPGYRVALFRREVIDGISVIRVPLYPSHDASAVKRVLNYASFALSAALLGPFLVKRAHVLYAYHPPATIAMPAIALRLLRGIPYVYDVMDLWPDTLAATGMVTNRFILKCVGLYCSMAYRLAGHIVVLSPGFRRMLRSRGVPEKKITVIHSWCDEKQTESTGSQVSPHEPRMAGRFNVVFAGTMGKAQGLDAVLDAAKLVRERCPAVQFVFVGGGIEVAHLRERVRAESMANVLFLPRLPVSEIGSVLRLADVLLVHLKDDPLFRITIPSKTQAYLAAGRPILMAVRGDASELVERAGAGMSCTPEDPQNIADAVEMLSSMQRDQLETMGESGRRFYQRELSLQQGVRHFDEIFRIVARKEG